MAITFNSMPNPHLDLKPRIVVVGVGGAGGNAVNNMIQSGLEGVEFLAANTDAQALSQSRTNRRIQLGTTTTQGLGAGSRPDIGRAAAEEALDDLIGEITGANMAFITAGMGGGTGTGAAPVIARAAREQGILTVGVVTKPFTFEGHHRMRLAEAGIEELQDYVDTLIIIPNQNLFRIATQKTTFAEAFKMADDVLCSGVRGVTDLMVMPGLINLDFADIRTVMGEMGKAHMGTGEAAGERRAIDAAEAAIANPLLDDTSMRGARGVLINITGGNDLTLFEVDEAANRIRDEADPEANIIFGSTFDSELDGKIRISVVATGIEAEAGRKQRPTIFDHIGRNHQRDQPIEIAARPNPAPVAPAPAPVMTAQPVLAAPEPVAPPAAPAAPAARGLDAFIPPAPEEFAVDEATTPPPAPGPMAVADVINGGKADPSVPAQPAAPAPVVSVATSVTQPAPKAKSNLFGVVTGLGRSRPAPAPAPTPAQPRLGGLDPQDRPSLSKNEEDTLEIPAFLRRQAN
jgi:cell division protein FtsZ